MARPSRKKNAFFALWCTVCHTNLAKRIENYIIMLNPNNLAQKGVSMKEFVRNKYCSRCRRHNPHKAKQVSRSQNK